MNIEEHRTVTEPVERLKKILLDDSEPDRTIKIGTPANPMAGQALTTFLKDNRVGYFQPLANPYPHHGLAVTREKPAEKFNLGKALIF